jgi:hypothetical protein
MIRNFNEISETMVIGGLGAGIAYAASLSNPVIAAAGVAPAAAYYLFNRYQERNLPRVTHFKKEGTRSNKVSRKKVSRKKVSRKKVSRKKASRKKASRKKASRKKASRKRILN